MCILLHGPRSRASSTTPFTGSRLVLRASLLKGPRSHTSINTPFTSLQLVLRDEDIYPLHTMQGSITRACARQLDLQVCSNLVNCFLELTLGFMHVLLIRNN
jgi:hypothetical protein